MSELTNDELRLAIAKAKGYMVESPDSDVPIWYAITSPINHTFITNLYAREIDAWTEAICSRLPNWPEDIAAAWELVEEMKADGYANPQVFTATDNDQWHCAYRFAGDQGFAFFDADTATRAICLAWLAWQAERAK